MATRVQNTYVTFANVATKALAFSSAVVANNRVIGAVRTTGGTLDSVTDDASNTYTIDQTVAYSPWNLYVFSAPLIAGGGTAVTVTLHMTNGSGQVFLCEYSGLGTLTGAPAVSASGSFSNSSSQNSPYRVTTTAAPGIGDMVVALIVCGSVQGGAWTADSGDTVVDTTNAHGNGNWAVLVEKQAPAALAQTLGGATGGSSASGYAANEVAYVSLPPPPPPGTLVGVVVAASTSA